MWHSGETVPLARLVTLFCVLFVAGTALTLPLYRFDVRRFVRSKLFVKIVLWVPIFAVFIGFLYAGGRVRFAGLAALLIVAEGELIAVVLRRHDRHQRRAALVYGGLFGIALLHFWLLGTVYPRHLINLLISIGVASVLADVMAFFLGNYAGKHKLPAALNDHKSWEGVAGQLIGAGLGVLLVNAFVTPIVSAWIWLPIGAGSALGDLTNSYVKRRLELKDWSQNLPGHGGYLDRLSSLAGSVLCAYYFLLITGLA